MLLGFVHFLNTIDSSIEILDCLLLIVESRILFLVHHLDGRDCLIDEHIDGLLLGLVLVLQVRD